MKLASYTVAGRASWGVVTGDQIADVGAVLSDSHQDLKGWLAAPDQDLLGGALPRAPRFSFNQVRLLPVIPNPAKIICVGHNYDAHRLETGRDTTSHPAVIIRFPDTQVAHGDTIRRPAVSGMLDYEGELAIVIGKEGRSIPAARAFDHVAGYTCFNDASIRDWQWHTSQFTPGKNFPGTGASGPWLVTADEITDTSDLAMWLDVNGRRFQSGSTRTMIFRPAFLVRYLSQFMSLQPGDIISTGTPPGVGLGQKPPIYLNVGDTVTLSIAGLGIQRQVVVDSQAATLP